MWSILSKIDPDTALYILGAIGGYLWHLLHKGKKEAKQRESSVLDDIVTSIVYELLDKYPLNVPVEIYLKNSRGFLEAKIWDVAKKRGIPKNRITTALVHAAIERGGAMMAAELQRMRELTREDLRKAQP